MNFVSSCFVMAVLSEGLTLSHNVSLLGVGVCRLSLAAGPILHTQQGHWSCLSLAACGMISQMMGELAGLAKLTAVSQYALWTGRKHMQFYMHLCR